MAFILLPHLPAALTLLTAFSLLTAFPLPAAFSLRPLAACLPHLKGSALRMACLMSAVSCDADMLCMAAAVLIVYTVHRLAVHLQTGLRCLKQVLEGSLSLLVETSAAGIAGLLCLTSIYDNGLLAAAVIRIVKAVLYTTFQFCHDSFLLYFLDSCTNAW